MANANNLVQIPRSDWPQLRDLYHRDWPTNLVGFYTVDTYLHWVEQRGDDLQHLVMYSLDGDWKSDGTFICIHRHQVFGHTLEPHLDRLQRLLNALDWSRDAYILCTLYERYLPAVRAIANANRMVIDGDYLTLFYYMPREQAIQLDITCPPGLTLRALDAEQHAPIVHDAYPHRQFVSLFFLKQIIELNPNVGAFDENDQLVAWCLRWEAGPHGGLQVLDAYQRRGLGVLLCKAMSKKLAQLGYDSCACVLPDNEPSTRTFERAGFRVIDNVHWITSRPSNPNNERTTD